MSSTGVHVALAIYYGWSSSAAPLVSNRRTICSFLDLNPRLKYGYQKSKFVVYYKIMVGMWKFQFPYSLLMGISLDEFPSVNVSERIYLVFLRPEHLNFDSFTWKLCP